MRGPRRRYPPTPAELRNRRSSRLITVAAIGGVLFIAGAASAFAIGIMLNPALDEELCPQRQPVAREVIVFLDTTDPWNATQRTAIHNQFARLQASLPRFARLHLYALEPTLPDPPVPVLRLCNPGELADFAGVPVVGRASAWLFSNPAQVTRWRDDFTRAADSVLAGIAADDGVAHASPIMETSRALALHVFDRTEPATPRALYFFSDMLQHSPLYSHYRAPEWRVEDAHALADVAALGTRALDDVEVTIFLLDLGDGGPGRGAAALSMFWEAWFARQGAAVERVRRIEG
jgi:hypothetical protein